MPSAETRLRTPVRRRNRLPAAIIAAYAAVAYLCFLAVLSYSVAFFADAVVPRTVDHGPSASTTVAVVVDLLLLNLFALQHTVMARPWFKRAWTRIVPVAAERATFVLAASLVLAVLCWQWRPIHATAWQVHGAAAIPLRVLYVAGWVLAIVSTYLIDHADLFGLRQAWLRLRGRDYVAIEFTERSLYRHVRHPLMTGFLIVFWAAPVMTAGHLLFAAASTGYIVVGIAFEERDLVRSFGARYLAYRERVPALIPVPWRRRTPSRSTVRR